MTGSRLKGPLKCPAGRLLSPGPSLGKQKRMLTVQVLFLGPHHFMRGGFADGSGYGRSRNAVLSSCDAICQRLTRHLRTACWLLPALQGRNTREGRRGCRVCGRGEARQGGAQGTRALTAPPHAQWSLGQPGPSRGAAPPPRCVSLCLARSRLGQEEGYFRRCAERTKGK